MVIAARSLLVCHYLSFINFQLGDDFEGYSSNEFRLSPSYVQYIESILVTGGMIRDR